MNTIEWFTFEDLTPTHHKDLSRVVEEIEQAPEAEHVTRDYENDIKVYLQNGLGKVFIARRDENIAGFLVAIEKTFVPGMNGLPSERSKFYFGHHASAFAEELEAIGPFAFFLFMAVGKNFRRRNIGSELLETATSLFKSEGKVMIGSVVHESNYAALKLIENNGFELVDLFRSDDKRVIWFRSVRILDLKMFRAAIESDRLHKAFGTIIPILLNSAIRNQEIFLEKVNAKITWATFFQLNPILEHEFEMRKVYNGFYRSLSTEGEGNFRFVLNQLQKILGYFDKFERDGITPISSGLIKKGKFEIFTMDRHADRQDFPHFSNPIVLAINNSMVQSIMGFQEENNLFIQNSDEVNKPEDQWEEWLKVHKIIYDTDRKVHGEEITWCHAVIPMSFSHGITGLMFSFVVEGREAPSQLLSAIVRNIADVVAGTMTNVILKPRDFVIRKYRAKSAVATILLRNMAHNLGSHILAPLSDKSAIVKYLEKIPLSTFLAYLRTRIDFLADIATSSPVTAVSVSLHQDILRGFDYQKIVLEHISGVGGKRIRVEFQNALSNDSFSGAEDLLIQSPNGNLGYHAFYIILENIIRNCAKHQSKEFFETTQLKLTVKAAHVIKNNRYIALQITDNIKRARNEYPNLAHQLNKEYIQPAMFDKDDKMRQIGWGMLEMKIGAAYLRKIPGSMVDRVEGPPLIRAIEVPAGPSHYYLGFEIFVKRPRAILVLDMEGRLPSDIDIQTKVRNGIKIVGKAHLRNHPYQVQSHQVAVLLGDKPRSEIEINKIFPLRWIHLKTNQEIDWFKGLLRGNPERLILEIWKKWIKQYLAKKNIPTQPIFLVGSGKDKYAGLQNRAGQYENLVLFDEHGGAVLPGTTGKDPILGPDDLGKLLYYQSYSNIESTPKRLNIHELTTNPFQKERLGIEIIEAALTRVIVIDERIQSAAGNKQARYPVPGLDYNEELRLMNIYVPRKDEVDLDGGMHDMTNIRKWLKEQLEGKRTDFLVIHFGIIEKMLGTGSTVVGKFIREEVKTLDDRVEVIITSGRGKPNFISKKALFLHFSNISRYLLDERNKLHLTWELFSARTRLANHE